MGPLGELFATTDRQALEFFFVGLKDVSEARVDTEELLYNASVLAHYAQISTSAALEVPAPANLSEVFDQFVFNDSLQHDAAMMEIAGTQCLLLAGFFEDQMRRRHSIRWYAQLGEGFFHRAAGLDGSPRKAQLLRAIGLHFELWRQRHARLSRELRDQPYLLAPPHGPA